MTFKGALAGFLLILLFEYSHAQLRLEQVPLSPIKANTGFFVYGAGNFTSEIPYSKINGHPFLNPEFGDATLQIGGKQYGPCPVRLDIVSHELHFLNAAKEELIAQQGVVEKVVFTRMGNETDTLSVFRNDIEEINMQPRLNGLYVQEMNRGTLQLLKVSKKKLQSTDSLFGTQKKYSFVSEEFYFLKNKNRVHALKKLNRREVFPLLVLDKESQQWAEKHAVNYSKEEDVVALLSYVNARKQ